MSYGIKNQDLLTAKVDGMAGMMEMKEGNPLLIQNILENVFQHVDVRCVAKCRQVCTKWDKVATPIFKTRIHEIDIWFWFEFDWFDPPHQNTESESEDLFPKEENSIRRYMKMIESSQFNFTTFTFHHWPMDEKWAQKFFSQRGQFIRKLKLVYGYDTRCSDSPVVSSKQFQDILVKYAPNIEELNLTLMETYLQNSPIFDMDIDSMPAELRIKKIKIWCSVLYDSYDPDFFISLLLPCKNLESVSMYDSPVNQKHYDCMDRCDEDDRFDNVLLNALIDTGRIKGIKELNLASVTSDIVDILGSDRFLSSNCQLTRFTTPDELVPNFSDSRWIDWMKFEKFLMSQQNSLEYLCILLTNQNPYQKEISHFKFPTMKNLKTLELYLELDFDQCNFNFGRIHLEPMDFGNQFPTLVELKIHGVDVDTNMRCERGWARERELEMVSERANSTILELFSLGFTRCTSLKKLTITNMNMTLPNPDIITLRIGQIFPNLTFLDFACQSYKVVPSLWAAFPNLETLILEVDTNGMGTRLFTMDSIFTGLSENYCKMYKMQMGLVKRNLCDEYFDTDEFLKFKTRAGISDLKKLRKLELKCREHYGREGCGYSGYTAKGERISPERMLSDISVRLGLMKLNKPTSIFLGTNCHEKMSKECIDEICTHLGLSARFNRKWNDFFTLTLTLEM